MAEPIRVIAGHTSIMTVSNDTAKAKPVKMKDSVNNTGTTPWAPYGDDDDFPTYLIDKLGKLSIGKPSLCMNADAHFGAGIEWIRKVYDGGKILKQPFRLDLWEKFVDTTNYPLVHSDLVQALETFYWAPVRFLTNLSRTEIREVEVLDPVFTRKAKRNDKGVIPSVFFSYKFPESPSESERVEYPLYDPLDDTQFEFVVIFQHTTFGRVYYPIPDYYAVFENGWVDIAISVPQFIKTVYKFSANIKYHIEVPAHFFPTKYKDWDERSEKDQIRLMEEEQKRMEAFLMGEKNAHGTFVSVFGIDDDGREIPGWRITPIQDYMKKDADLPNNTAANMEIMYAMSHDPALSGAGTPGGKDLSGSGSDKREASKVQQSYMGRERLVSLAAPYFIMKFMGADLTDVEPKYVDVDTSATLDKNPTGKENNIT